MTDTKQAPVAPVEQKDTKQTKPDFGSGRYSPLMEEVFHDSQIVFQLTEAKAEKLARAIATEIGAIMSSRPVEVKLGKLSKDGKLTISEAAKIKGVTLTLNVYSLRALQFAGEAGKNGFSFNTTEWQPIRQLAEYFASL